MRLLPTDLQGIMPIARPLCDRLTVHVHGGAQQHHDRSQAMLANPYPEISGPGRAPAKPMVPSARSAAARAASSWPSDTRCAMNWIHT